MAKPTTRAELIEYALRALGKPVISINVDDDQLNDRVDEALQFYQEYHSDAVILHYRKHQVTQEDIDNGYLTLPDDLLFVTRILPHNSSTRDMFSIDYQMHLNDIYDLRNSGSIVTYEMTKQYMSLLNMTFENGLHQCLRFNRHMDRLYIDTNWSAKFKVGDYIVIEGYTTLDPDEYTDVYNDLFLKRYLVALIKRNWGANLKKFSGMQLIGGVEFNGQVLFDEAQADLTKLEEDIYTKYEMPPMGAIG